MVPFVQESTPCKKLMDSQGHKTPTSSRTIRKLIDFEWNL